MQPVFFFVTDKAQGKKKMTRIIIMTHDISREYYNIARGGSCGALDL